MSDKSLTAYIQSAKINRELGPIRPPSEFDSLLLRVVRNCTWNRCLFCPLYDQENFDKRNVQEVLTEIDDISREIQNIIKWDGHIRHTKSTRTTDFSPGAKISKHTVSSLYSINSSLSQIAYWLYMGGKKVFLQDADALVIPPHELITILNHISNKLPTVTNITCYSRSKTLTNRDSSDLSKFQLAGLSRIHMGLESGNDQVLKLMNKGVSTKEQIAGGIKTVSSGITLTMYVILGLGGRELSKEHAKDTAYVINQVNPNFVRLRTLSIPPNGPLHRLITEGEFTPLNDDEIITEQRELIKNLNCNTFLTCDHRLNLFEGLKGQLPVQKQSLIKYIDSYLSMPFEKRLNYQLGRRMGVYRNLSDMSRISLYQQVSNKIDDLGGYDYPDAIERHIEQLKQRLLL